MYQISGRKFVKFAFIRKKEEAKVTSSCTTCFLSYYFKPFYWLSSLIYPIQEQLSKTNKLHHLLLP